ncbi:COX15/CtaA family protein [Bdellovibrio sp. HCB337]|uniref:COX15/CtaA family protein n=1 Tax=Bdellovibrio sp. HCB337 TaxID=3394358 RepID=UPI0039A58183
MKTKSALHRFAQFLLIYTLLVILWGAWVRISHSGDGCGDTWPLCNGKIIPEAEHKKTWVEFSHRLTSGLFGLLVIYLFWIGRKLYEKQEPVRKAILATLIFTITEALLGAKLVLFGLVGSNDSPFRLFVMGLHQVNSLLLSGSVALVVLYSSDLPNLLKNAANSKEKVPMPKWAVSFLILFVVIAVTGAFASLSTTLFPSTSLFEGITQDFAPDAHYLLRLRISHPILATLIGGSLALYFWLRSQVEQNEIVKKATLQVTMIFVIGVVFGYITLFSLAPIWMKVAHLLIAHVIWITLLRWYSLKKLALK